MAVAKHALHPLPRKIKTLSVEKFSLSHCVTTVLVSIYMNTFICWNDCTSTISLLWRILSERRKNHRTQLIFSLLLFQANTSRQQFDIFKLISAMYERFFVSKTINFFTGTPQYMRKREREWKSVLIKLKRVNNENGFDTPTRIILGFHWNFNFMKY